MNLHRRIKQLEARMGVTPRRRHLVTNVDFGGCTHKLFPGGPFVDVIGSPLTDDELEQLREKYRRDTDEP